MLNKRESLAGRIQITPINLIGLDLADLKSLLIGWDEPAYRARQLYHWLYARRSADFATITNLSLTLREKLQAATHIGYPHIIANQQALDGTQKLLFGLEDGERVEAVLIPEGERLTLCLSSQVGCLVGCPFCATGLMGFRRNLTVGEIVGQLLAVESLISTPNITDGNEVQNKIPQSKIQNPKSEIRNPKSEIRNPKSEITNIVLMGMGEPLLNRRAVFKAARLITDPDGIGLPARKLTISTVGWVPGIRAMTKALSPTPHPGRDDFSRPPLETRLPRVKLAVSLNATTDDQRRRIMPLVARYPLRDIVSAAREYALASKLPVALNYLLLAGENDSDADASQLTRLLLSPPQSPEEDPDFSPPRSPGGNERGGNIPQSKIQNPKSKISFSHRQMKESASLFKINLMEYNEVGSPFTRASGDRTEAFLNLLRNAGLTVTLRTSRGGDIAGACGQLAGNYEPGSGRVLETQS